MLTGQSAHVDETDSVLLSRLEGDSCIVVDIGTNIHSLGNITAQVFTRCGVHNVEGNRIRNRLSASRVNLYHIRPSAPEMLDQGNSKAQLTQFKK